MPRRASRKLTLATEAWRAIFDLIIATAAQRTAVLARLDLTPNDSRALASLDPHAGRTMRALAEEWQCDASTATWIIDRLETKGLAERRPHATDRRAKLVVLTPLGAQTKSEMIRATYSPPLELLELSEAELLALRDATLPLRGLASTS